MRRLTLQGRPARERNAALDHPWIKLEKNAERNSCIYRAGRGEDLLIYLRLLIFDNNRRISRYSQIKVTIRPKAAYHSMYLGTPARAPFSMKSKSSTKFSEAMMTINTLTPIPR